MDCRDGSSVLGEQGPSSQGQKRTETLPEAIEKQGVAGAGAGFGRRSEVPGREDGRKREGGTGPENQASPWKLPATLEQLSCPARPAEGARYLSSEPMACPLPRPGSAHQLLAPAFTPELNQTLPHPQSPQGGR